MNTIGIPNSRTRKVCSTKTVILFATTQQWRKNTKKGKASDTPEQKLDSQTL